MKFLKPVLLGLVLLLGACQTASAPNLVHSLKDGALPPVPASKARIYVLGEPVSSGNFITPMAMLNDRPLFRIDSGKYFVIDVEAGRTVMLRTELSSETTSTKRVRTYGFYNPTPNSGEELYFRLKFSGSSDIGVVLAGESGRPRTYTFTKIDPEEARLALPTLSLAFYNSL